MTHLSTFYFQGMDLQQSYHYQGTGNNAQRFRRDFVAAIVNQGISPQVARQMNEFLGKLVDEGLQTDGIEDKKK